ncbi:MAG: biotin--[acetyl-CoA-carboxylase] ligase [Leptospiraceae bacterium]|nr:biotin--[acetyl-CoA-carboxylase] ligase [Leptospiraceae bacterium]MDW8306214.1 biotin--[acetyl-CoA-carboxylase] ligase [Leptospiraceae bacterium]
MISKSASRLEGFLYLEKCPSTNSFLIERKDFLERHGRGVYTLNQSAGRGRLGNIWYSPPGNLAMSMVLHAQNWRAASLLPLRVGLIAYKTLSSYDSSLCIKWPNDILREGKKVAGILCEAVEGVLCPPAVAVVVGLGVNLKPIGAMVAHVEANGHLLARELAVSLCQISGEEETLDQVFISQWEKAAHLPCEFYYAKKGKSYLAHKLFPNGILQVSTGSEYFYFSSMEILDKAG